MDRTTGNATDAATVRRKNRLEYRAKPLPPVSDLLTEARRIFAYSEAAKGLVWREQAKRKGPRAEIGSLVGWVAGDGYRCCYLLGQVFRVHRLVWMLRNGEIPCKPLDHINGDRQDNRIGNLRLAEDFQNAQNRRNCLEPTAGVQRHHNGRKYRAVVQHMGKKIRFGSFETEEEARDAYVEVKRQVCGEFSPL